MDITNLPVLGEGRLSMVYKLDGGKMLKVFRYPDICPWEFKQSMAAWQAGVSRQQPHETLTVDGKDAIIYDYLEGRVLVDAMKENVPAALRYFRMMADCHARILGGTSAGLRRLKDSLGHAIAHAPHISDAQRALLTKGLESMPDGDHVLHGDLHPMNIIINGNELEAIDWMTACRGDPAADICRTWLILRFPERRDKPGLPDELLRIAISRLASQTYLRRAMKVTGVKRAAVMRWLPYVAAGRLCENRPPLEVKGIQQIIGKWYAAAAAGKQR
jgi:aminoglycoside phosphotransferase (APT) family kinase protein